MQVWSRQVKWGSVSQSLYQAFDVRCLAPNTLPTDANIDCVRCSPFFLCSSTCAYCEDQSTYGLAPLRAMPTYSNKVRAVHA